LSLYTADMKCLRPPWCQRFKKYFLQDRQHSIISLVRHRRNGIPEVPSGCAFARYMVTSGAPIFTARSAKRVIYRQLS